MIRSEKFSLNNEETIMDENALVKIGISVVPGTHPIPQKYYLMHQKLRTWDSPFWQEITRHVLSDETKRLEYD